MNFIKKSFLFAFLFILGTAAVSAQQGERPERGDRERATPEQRAEKIADRMAEQLDLSTEQRDEIYRINLAYAAQRKGARDQAKQHREAQRAEVENVLTPEQLAKLEALKAERKANRKEGRKGEGRRRRGGK